MSLILEVEPPVVEFQQKIRQLYKELAEVQDKCLHSKQYLEVKHCGNTGNYSPSDDHYWIDYKCNWCGKRWSVDQ